MRAVRCGYCAKAIPEGSHAMRKRGYTGFYCSCECLVLDTRIGYEEIVTDKLVQEDKECNGIDWEEINEENNAISM